MKTNSHKNKLYITKALIVITVLFSMIACNKEEKPTIAAVTDRAAMPRLQAKEITTVISDSGVTRYRISTPEWNVYDKANQPYWEFPKGIHCERFDENLNVDANIHSNYAKFKENEQLWELRGKVKSTNIKGELFETEHLFWDQRLGRFYSDTLVKITQATRIIKGIGFESDQSMSHYTINKPQGIFPVEEDANAAPQSPSTPPNPIVASK